MNDNIVVVAKIGAPHGVRGQLKLHSFTTPPKNILNFNELYYQKDGEWQLLSDAKVTVQHSNFLLSIPEYHDRDKVRVFVNVMIGVPRLALGATEANEYFWSDLVGSNIVHVDGAKFGVVDHLLETGSNDVLVVKGDRERLVPFIDSVIVSVDVTQKQIVVDWDKDF